MNDKSANGLGTTAVGAVVLTCLLLVFAAAHSLSADEPKKTDLTFPKQVLIIRHAEKPPPADKSVHISEQGEMRAKALYQLFEASPNRPDPFPKPDFLFATHKTENSHRPIETATPLAKKLELPLNDSFRHNANLDLSKELFGDKRYKGKIVLVCWHHGAIPALAAVLRATDAPKDWDSNTFDRVWQITYDEKGAGTCIDRPQQLLPGDSKK
jgi:hypothetical protein